jgi:hypothetical protein
MADTIVVGARGHRRDGGLDVQMACDVSHVMFLCSEKMVPTRYRLSTAWEMGSGSRDLQLADGLGLTDAAGNTAASVEADPTLCCLAVRVAQDRQRDAVEDAITLLELAEDDRERSRADVRHVREFKDRPPEQRGNRRVVQASHRHHVIAVSVLQLADGAKRGAVHAPRTIDPVMHCKVAMSCRSNPVSDRSLQKWEFFKCPPETIGSFAERLRRIGDGRRDVSS